MAAAIPCYIPVVLKRSIPRTTSENSVFLFFIFINNMIYYYLINTLCLMIYFSLPLSHQITLVYDDLQMVSVTGKSEVNIFPQIQKGFRQNSDRIIQTDWRIIIIIRKCNHVSAHKLQSVDQLTWVYLEGIYQWLSDLFF